MRHSSSFARPLARAQALLFCGAALWAGAATAQEALDPSNEIEPDDDASIVVVGSRVGGFAEEALPVSIIDEEDLENFGAVNTGELLSYIPAVGDVQFTDSNTGTNGARGDVASVSLRGLGSGNTLSLIDGRRIVNHPLSQAIDDAPVTFYNVNAIPSSSIKRIEILRDGASAIYGADATAGVANFVTYDDYEGLLTSLRYGFATGNNLDEVEGTIRAGTTLNGGKTRINVSGTYYHRNPVFYSELPEFYRNLDRRQLVPDPDFIGDTQFDNRSSLAPFGAFTAGIQNPDGSFTPRRVRRGTTSLTTTSGVFHVEPAGNDVVVRSGSLPRDFRYNFIADEILIPEVTRYNASIGVNHDFSDTLEFFGNLTYYNSNSVTQRAAGPFDASLARIVIPKENFYNPFGPVGSPNRLPGIDAPASGLDIVINGYRNIEIGPRIIEVEQDSYRGIAGLRGALGVFEWESAFVYSEANVRDEEFNRTSKSLLQTQASLTTPDAFNFFNGPFVNPESVLQNVRISGVREGKSTMTLGDFRVTSNKLLELPGGPLGVAAGVEFRRETIFDDSDPRLDGTLQFTNGAVPDESDVVGVSATSDFGGSREVYSAYLEIVFPLVSDDMDIPLVHSLDIQLAGRVEEGSDFRTIFTPKVAAFYSPFSFFSFRGSYGEGFRAPNLAQLNQGTITRRAQGDTDFYRAAVTGTPADLGDTYRPSLRQGNPNLQPEESKTYTAGVVLHPGGIFRGFTASLDFFRFEQKNLISTFGAEEQLALDFLLRLQGDSNPNVIREAPTAADIAAFNAFNAANPGMTRAPAGEVTLVLDNYINLDPRTVEGLDFHVGYTVPEFGIGRFKLDASATHFLKFEQRKDSIQPLLDNPVLAPSFSSVAPDRLRLNGNPRWRATGTVNWELDRYSLGGTVRHVSSVFDTSATQDQTGEFFRVDSWTTFNLRAAVALGDEGTALWGTKLAAGAINLTNELAPVADESAGFFDNLHNMQGRVFYVQLSKEF